MKEKTKDTSNYRKASNKRMFFFTVKSMKKMNQHLPL